MKSVYRDRLSRVMKTLSRDPFAPAALLVSSAPEIIVSRDTAIPYRQDSDFFYLSGSSRSGLCLLIRAGWKRPVLYARTSSANEILWNGRAADPAPLAQALGAELKTSDDPERLAIEDIKGVSHLYFQNTKGSAAWKIASRLMETPSHCRSSMPGRFSHSDCLLQSLRLHKDPHEIKLMSEAIEATCRAYHAVVPLMLPGVSEKQIASCLEAAFSMRQCTPAFPSIVASGPSAAVLHYTSFTRRLKKGELLLIDCGAACSMYCADMTRVFPVGGIFKPWQRDLYEVVLAAQKAAIKRVRHGAPVSALREAAARVMTEGLVDLKVLRGKVSALMAKQACQTYFPHGIGHPLGIDVHDIGPHRSAKDAILEAGMVITIEPGLYFPRRIGKLQPSGVRIEDDVLVTRTGCRVLTSAFPKEPGEIEDLF